MADETKTTTAAAPEASCEKVVVPVAEKPTTVVEEKEVPPQPEPEKEEALAEEKAAEKDGKEENNKVEDQVGESGSFKEESNKVDDLVDPEKKALDELKALIQEALNKHEITAPPAAKEKKKDDQNEKEVKVEEKKEGDRDETAKADEKAAAEACSEAPAAEAKEEEKKVDELKAEEKKEEEPKAEEKKETCEALPAAAEPAPAPAVEPLEAAAIEKEAVEEIKETIVHEVTAPAPPPCDEEPAAVEEATLPPPPEEVSIWGVPLLADERSDVILLKFLRARDFKAKEAFAMLKTVVAWRKEFKIDELVEEEEVGSDGLEKVGYIHGVDKEGHPVCYNAFGEFQDKELYSNTFSDAEKRAKFLRWYIQFLEKSIRKLDFSPDGVCTIVQVTDLKNSPGLILFKKELRQATNQALQLLQDNYPEFVARQVFINVPWWYVAYNRMISPFLTQRTKSKFVFAGPTRTTETLFKYIAPEQVPVQYGGLSKEGEQDFTATDPATEETIKPTCKHTIELPITEACPLIWEVKVVGWDVSYGAEFVPSDESAYTWIVQKPRKIGPTDEQIVGCTFKIGEPGKVVLTFDNQTSKKKKLLYRSKTKPSE